MRRQILSIMADKVRFSKLHRYIYSWSDQLSIYGSQTPLPCLWHFVFLFHSITFQSFAMTTFFVYINYIAPRLVKTYMHCMWSSRQSCVICFVCYRYTCVRVLLWLITADCLRWATQRSWPLKLSAAIIMWSMRPTNVNSQRNGISSDRLDR